jgi:hypothetical protein
MWVLGIHRHVGRSRLLWCPRGLEEFLKGDEDEQQDEDEGI